MTKLEALNKLIYKITGEHNRKNTIEGAISFLVKKIVGEDPNTETIADALNYFADNYISEGGKRRKQHT